MIDIRQLSGRLQPLIQQARNEKKVLFHPKIFDKNGNPKFISPEELEENVDRYPYEKEEWKLADPEEDPQGYKAISEIDKGNLDRAIFVLNEMIKKEDKK